MIKNMTDVIFGGLAYLMLGYGLSFGDGPGTNALVSVGSFFTYAEQDDMGHVFAKFLFQLSFASAATTIVPGAMSERTNYEAYAFLSFLQTLSHAFPAHWLWHKDGFLKKLGALDIAGGGPLHLLEGCSALVATVYLGPRRNRFNANSGLAEMASPTNAVLGTFVLLWGWLVFNCGSTFGVSGGKWELASRASINTINGAVGGGIFSAIYSFTYTKYKRKLDITIFMSGIISGLVGVTAICTICHPWEALLIGLFGAVFSCFGIELLERLQLDDPVSCVPVHAFAGIWSLLAVGIFADYITIEGTTVQLSGFFKSWNLKLFGEQILTCVCIISWAVVITPIELFVADKIFELRVSPQDEMLGADFCTHGIPLRLQPEEEKPELMKLSEVSKISNAAKKDTLVSVNHEPDILEDISTGQRSAQN